MKKRTSQPKCYAIYARVSSVEQASKEFSSVDVQIKQCREYIIGKGCTVIEVYRDDGFTGTNTKRPDFQRLLADAKQGRFEAVAVTFLNRLGRGDACTIAEYLLKEEGVTVQTVREEFGQGMSGFAHKGAKKFADGMLVESVREATASKMEEMVARGFFCGGVVPFGYDKQIITEALGFHKGDKEPPKRLVPHPVHAETVAQAYDLYLEKHSMAAVREYLKIVTDRLWTTTKVKELLTKELYKGDYVFGQWRNNGSQPALVSAEVWQAVQETIGSQGSRPARSEDDFTYYVRGTVRCPHCGCSYTQASAWGRNSRVHYYTCLKANKYGAKCPVNRVNAERLHHTILHNLEYAAKHQTVMHRIIAQSGGWNSPTETQRSLRGQLSKKLQFLGVQINNMLNAVGDGRGSGLILNRLEQLEKQQQETREELARADEELDLMTIKRPTAEQVAEVWGQVGELWDELTEVERAELLGGLVKEVVVTEKNRVLLKLSPVAEGHGSWFAIKSEMGAGAGLEPATFRL